MLTQLVPVDKSTVAALKEHLYKLIKSAQDITVHSTYERIRQAKESLDKAIGLHMALSALDLIDDYAVTEEDLERIERKYLSILEDKRRHDYPRWKC